MKTLQRGFAILEIIIVLVALAVLGVIAWRVYQTYTSPGQSADTSSEQSVVEVPAVTKSSDLDTLKTQLDSAQVDDSTISDLEKESAF